MSKSSSKPSVKFPSKSHSTSSKALLKSKGDKMQTSPRPSQPKAAFGVLQPSDGLESCTITTTNMSKSSSVESSSTSHVTSSKALLKPKGHKTQTSFRPSQLKDYEAAFEALQPPDGLGSCIIATTNMFKSSSVEISSTSHTTSKALLKSKGDKTQTSPRPSQLKDYKATFGALQPSDGLESCIITTTNTSESSSIKISSTSYSASSTALLKSKGDKTQASPRPSQPKKK